MKPDRKTTKVAKLMRLMSRMALAKVAASIVTELRDSIRREQEGLTSFGFLDSAGHAIAQARDAMEDELSLLRKRKP